MNRFRSGMVPLFALLILVGCNSEPTGDLRNGPAELVASPTQLFIEIGRSKSVEVGAIDGQGNQLDFDYQVSSPGTGITVRRDSSFLPIFVNDSTLQAPAVGPRFRFIVTATGYTATTFTVSAGGLDIVIPVQVIPEVGLAATFDNPTPALGETVTLTAPAGITFADTANLVIAGNPLIPFIVSQDATTIRFIPPPNVNAPVTVNGVIAASAPGIVFAPATETALQTPLIDTVDVVYSTTTPALGQTVSMSVTEPLINLVVDSIIFPGQLPGRVAGPTNIVVAADSNSLTFDTPPNVDGAGTVVNFAFPGDFLIALPTRPSVTGPNIGTTIDATFSNQTPALLETVTLTAPAGFSFDAGRGGHHRRQPGDRPVRRGRWKLGRRAADPRLERRGLGRRGGSRRDTRQHRDDADASRRSPCHPSRRSRAPMIRPPRRSFLSPGQTIDAGTFDAASCGAEQRHSLSGVQDLPRGARCLHLQCRRLE